MPKAKDGGAATTGDVATWMDVDRKTVVAAAERGELKGWRTSTAGHWRFAYAAVATYLEAHGKTVPAELAAKLPAAPARKTAAPASIT